MKNMKFFLQCLAMVMFAQQEVAALQTKFFAKSSINAFVADCSCNPDGTCDGCCKTDDED